MREALPGFELDVQRSRLFRDGQEVDLEPKVFDLLRYLIEHPHRLISKQELKREVWQAQRLSDGVTANAVAKLRRALGQPAEAAAPIETVRGRGYIFHPPRTANEDPKEAARAAAVPGPPSEEQDPFVGRDAALDKLVKKLERARRGAAALVLVCGPAGIGKTRLVKEFVRRAGLDGTSAWLGAAYEGEGFPPYWPWIQIVREAQRSEPAAFARALPKGAHLLSHWVSGVDPLHAPGEAPDPQTVRFRLFDELTRCLRALAAEGPRLVLLDDLQWADAGSIDLLGHAVRALDASPVLFVATLRDEEAHSSSVDDTLSKVSRVATRVRLAGLTEEESRTLAHSLRGDDPPPEAHLRELFQRSEGNPFFIRQFLEWWTEAGADLARRDGLPPGARDMIRRRLASLPSQTQRVLAAASVLGAQFRASRLSQMLGESTDAILEALATASRLAVVSGVLGTDEFVFTHALLQETLYQDIDVQTRGALHSRAADSFGSDTGSASAGHMGERARHLVHALPSRLEEAVRACEGAAKAAQRSAGFERASDLLSLAINKLEIEGSSPEEQARLWIEFADNHFFAAALDRAWPAYERAAELLRSAGSSALLARLAPPMVRAVNMGSGDAEFARALVDEVLRTLPAEALRERGCTLAQKAQLALELSAAERNALLDEGEACLDDPLVRIEVAYARNMLRDPTTLEQNERAASALLALTEAENPEPTTIRYRTLHRLGVHFTRYVCATISCDLEAADRALAEIALLAASSHMRAVEVVLALMRAARALGDGRIDELTAILTGSLSTLTDTLALNEALRSYQLQLAEAKGSLELLEKLELPPPPERTNATPRQRTDMVIMHAYFYAQTGRPERARDLLERVPRRDIERMPVLYGDLGVLSGLARIYIELGDEPSMRFVYDKLLPFAGRNALMPSFAYHGAVDHFLGMLADKLGDRARAREHLQAAVEINRRLGMPRRTSDSEALLESLG
jgi:DNA-binding winged helix-turn-helix (wHTH) protein/tetratricopeptide (TPR) repeat protein